MAGSSTPPRQRFSPWRIAPFLVIALSVLATMHGAVWFRLIRGIGLGLEADAAGALALGTGALITVGALVSRIARVALPAWFGVVGTSWLGVVFMAFSATLVTEPLRWLLPWGGISIGPWLSISTVGGLGLTILYGIVRAQRPTVVRVSAPVTGLHPALAGFRIVQLSDVHVDAAMATSFLDAVVARVEELEPDMVVITGDLVDGSVEEIGHKVAILARLQPRYGVFFVTGNHEYYSGAPDWVQFLEGLGVHVLRNAHVTIARGEAAFTLAGVDDLFGQMEPGHGMDLDQALEGRHPDQPVVLLSHQPVTVEAASQRGVALQLSGHTHGGQIFPFHFLVRTQQPYLSGLVRHGNTALYVHRGTGSWGPPIRIGAPAEIALLELTPA